MIFIVCVFQDFFYIQTHISFKDPRGLRIGAPRRFDTGGQLRFTTRAVGGQLHFRAVQNLRFTKFQSYVGSYIHFHNFFDRQKRHFKPKNHYLGGRTGIFEPFCYVSTILDRFSRLPPKAPHPKIISRGVRDITNIHSISF